MSSDSSSTRPRTPGHRSAGWRAGTPLVSTILIFFNAGRFIEEAIASVLAQTYTHWELLLVDDGSTDGSSDIAQRYAHDHPDRIRYFDHDGHDNRGMSASRNLGVRHATGAYIALLDADDVWLPNKLERQVAILESNLAAGMVYGATLYWRSWTAGDGAGEDYTPALGVRTEMLFHPPTLLTLQLTGTACSPCPSDVVLRREVVNDVGGFEDSFEGLFEDQAFFAKVKLRSAIFVSSECWDKYRLHPDSYCAVAAKAGQVAPARRRYLEWLEAYLVKHAVTDEAVRRVVRDQLWPFRHPALARLSRIGRDARAEPTRAFKAVARRLLPGAVQKQFRAIWPIAGKPPSVGAVGLGDLRRVIPFSRRFGYDRGLPVDRYYIERFLAAHADDIHGRVLEIKDDDYTRRFGGRRVRRSDVLHVVPGNPKATIVADLTDADHLPSAAFDCAIVTQVLPFIREPREAVRTLHRLLAPGGCILATLPGISQIDRHEMERWGDYWRFTSLSARTLFEAAFAPDEITIDVHGNVLSAASLLYGLASSELSRSELDFQDADYQVIIAVRAVKSRR